MAKSKLIKDLIQENISLSQALERIIVIAMELEDEDLLHWAKKEKSGYSNEDNLPDYRTASLRVIGTYQIAGYGRITTCRNQELPTMGMTDDMRQQINNHKITNGIPNILESIKIIDDGGQVGIPVPPELFGMFQKGTNISVLSAMFAIDKLHLTNIIDFTKTRMIEILTMLEKNFGCLDELDIDIRDYDSNEIAKLREELMRIIEGKATGTTYFITKSKIKNSNIGEGNQVEQETKVEVSPSVSVNTAEKKSLWQKIKGFFGGKRQ